MPLPTLLTARLILRPFHDDDAQAGVAFPSADAVGHIRELRRGALFGEATGLAICRRSDRALIGCVDARFERDEACFGLYLSPAARGHGFGFEAGRAFIDPLFAMHSPRVLLAHCAHDDGAAARVLTRLGFDLDGADGGRIAWRLRRLSWSVAQTSKHLAACRDRR
ncbi:hypothetical protein JHS3_26520 [Jeongeupia sp. HS-3]|uniref:GNAT family N-acetyltransferase n=1 Tax=Jeongeupia sp. HS-3 TaxID=1009682 RepID=UPI0018A39472|nr:GNAT family N-acetyltransferase [Jeongeupia sp. HS-3]BCL76916.1 hypothetical protein JHS3_26520 [Jeongeupia sp. HS-3]